MEEQTRARLREDALENLRSGLRVTKRCIEREVDDLIKAEKTLKSTYQIVLIESIDDYNWCLDAKIDLLQDLDIIYADNEEIEKLKKEWSDFIDKMHEKLKKAKLQMETSK